MIINFKVIYCKQAELPILCASYGCFPYQYHNVQYLKLKRRNKTEIIKHDFAHVINKKSIKILQQHLHIILKAAVTCSVYWYVYGVTFI
jgi:hypothetical protein